LPRKTLPRRGSGTLDTHGSYRVGALAEAKPVLAMQSIVATRTGGS
jgi:hypothetical protein